MAVVSGSSKEKIESILDENIGSNNFDFVISGDDLKEGQGKPDPASFQIAKRMNLLNSEALSPSSQKIRSSLGKLLSQHLGSQRSVETHFGT